MVPEPAAPKIKAEGGVAVQENGLPEGVKILPVNTASHSKSNHPSMPSLMLADTLTNVESNEPIVPAQETPEVPPSDDSSSLIKPRTRIQLPDPDTDKPKRRKPGRPKAGRLDTPRRVAMSAPAVTLPAAPKLAPTTVGETTPDITPSAAPAPKAPSSRRLSDISRRPAAEPERKAAKSHVRAKRPHVHKIGVPPLHYGAVLAFSLRARVRPRLLGLAALASASFAGAAGYGAWVISRDGLPHLSKLVQAEGYKVLIEALLLATLYYIGRSVGQAAIIYGVGRDADHRPVPMTNQLGVGINTFGRRLVLDIWFGLAELALLALIGLLVVVGGESWPINLQLQVVAIFVSFFVLLYFHTSLGITRGLAGTILTLTTHRPSTAAKLAWKLFSHRFELLGLRFLGAAMELGLALPLTAVAAAFIATSPKTLAPVVTLGVALLALVAGALFGVGTAAWWAGLYRRLVLVDHPDGAVSMLSGRQPQEARRAPLALIVSLSTLLICAILALPWIRLNG